MIFNADKAEINFSFKEASKIFPPMLTLNNKTYYFVIINLNRDCSASKVGTTEIITINENELSN